jgi:hypothetical protein
MGKELVDKMGRSAQDVIPDVVASLRKYAYSLEMVARTWHD